MPKTYDEFMKDISADELYDRMIQYGMFAEKLPSVFDGASFLAYCKDPSFALYYATKYNSEISSFDVNAVIANEDCVFDLMALIYCRKRKKTADQKTLKNYAKHLKANGVFDEFWLFAYESLSVGLVTDDWKGMKKANESFLKPEYK